MTDVDLLQAWSIWLSGIEPENLMKSSLWGHPIWWWGRVGKIVQFIAALTIIAEILGPERIHNFGNSLHDKFSIQVAINNLKNIKLGLRYFFNDPPPDISQDEWYEESKKYKISSLLFVIYVLLMIITLVVSVELLGDFLCIVPMIILAFVNLYLAIGISIGLVIIINLIGLGIDVLIIEPIAWLIDRPHFDKMIKIISVFLLLIGFHFDLLAS